MSAPQSQSPLCVIVGVGPGNGAAFVRRFAAEGYRVAMLARSDELMARLAGEIPQVRGWRCDVGDPAQVAASFAAIEAELGPVEVLVYNAGKGVWGSAEQVSVEDFEASWRTNTLGAFACAKAVMPSMLARGMGQMLFIGATASRRGGAQAAAFAPAKAAQRILAESLARSLWPRGIHVALVIIDGVVAEPVARARMPDQPDAFFVQPADLAGTLVMLTRQPRSAWTFELEARPFGEHW